ncbi:MAG: YheC/YheD family protein [Candidatus Gastranaerophilaceae bacterium]
MRNMLIVIDKLELKYFEFNQLVTNFWMVKGLLDNGIDTYITTIDNLSLKQGNGCARCFKTYEKDNDIFYEKAPIDFCLESFEKIFFRPDPPVNNDYINATYIFDFVDKNKVQIINDTTAIRNFNEKLHANYFKEFMPENIVTASKEEIEEFLNIHNEIILKPLNNCFGAGVMYLKKGDKNTLSIIKTVTNNFTSICMVQKYIQNAQIGDKRVIILDGEVLDECVLKIPTSDDFKFNTHSDEYLKKAVLTEQEKIKFTQVAKKLKEMGILMAGLDVIDEMIIEINVTSPCFFIKEINQRCSTRLEEKLNRFMLTSVKNHEISNSVHT